MILFSPFIHINLKKLTKSRHRYFRYLYTLSDYLLKILIFRENLFFINLDHKFILFKKILVYKFKVKNY